MYYPDHPQNAQIDPWYFIPGLSLFDGGTGLVLLLVGAFLFLLAGNHPSAELLHRYFTALENQDYVTAFQCLSPNMQVPERVPLTQDWFMRMQQESDRAQGRVTSHAITLSWSMTSNNFFSFRMAQASFTVKVTRGEKTAKIYPYVVQGRRTVENPAI